MRLTLEFLVTLYFRKEIRTYSKSVKFNSLSFFFIEIELQFARYERNNEDN